jgi:hypothetical protein
MFPMNKSYLYKSWGIIIIILVIPFGLLAQSPYNLLKSLEAKKINQIFILQNLQTPTNDTRLGDIEGYWIKAIKQIDIKTNIELVKYLSDTSIYAFNYARRCDFFPVYGLKTESASVLISVYPCPKLLITSFDDNSNYIIDLKTDSILRKILAPMPK